MEVLGLINATRGHLCNQGALRLVMNHGLRCLCNVALGKASLDSEHILVVFHLYFNSIIFILYSIQTQS